MAFPVEESMLQPMFIQWLLTDDKAKDHLRRMNLGIIDNQLKIISIQVKSIGNSNGKYDEKFPIY